MRHQPRYAIALDRGRIVEGEVVYDYGIRVLVNTRRQGCTAEEAQAEVRGLPAVAPPGTRRDASTGGAGAARCRPRQPLGVAPASASSSASSSASLRWSRICR